MQKSSVQRFTAGARRVIAPAGLVGDHAGAPAGQRRPDGSIDDCARADAADRAAWGLYRTRPEDSAYRSLDRAGHAWRRVGLGLAAAFAVLAPTFAIQLLAVFILVCVCAMAGFRFVAALTPTRQGAGSTSVLADKHPDLLPIYTVIAPVYQEADILPGLINALCELDYPGERLDVKIVVEEDDVETRAAAAAIEMPNHFEVLIVPPGEPRTKPRALNYALAFARGSFIAIYDAEDRPDPAQLSAALAAFYAAGPDLAVVQAPLYWWNAPETWITRQLALEYATQFHVILPALARWGWPAPLGGTSNHFRRASLEAVGGWDPHNVTEDADLGLRIAEAGGRFSVIAPPTAEEAPTSVRAWTRQRSRWLKGFMQTWLVRMRRPTRFAHRTGLGGMVALHVLVGMSVLASLGHGVALIVTLAGGAAMLLGWLEPIEPGALVVFGIGYSAAFAATLVGLVRAKLLRLAPHMAVTPLYWLLLTLPAVRAVRDLIARPFHWEKTTHGLTRYRPARSTPHRGDRT